MEKCHRYGASMVARPSVLMQVLPSGKPLGTEWPGRSTVSCATASRSSEKDDALHWKSQPGQQPEGPQNERSHQSLAVGELKGSLWMPGGSGGASSWRWGYLGPDSHTRWVNLNTRQTSIYLGLRNCSLGAQTQVDTQRVLLLVGRKPGTPMRKEKGTSTWVEEKKNNSGVLTTQGGPSGPNGRGPSNKWGCSGWHADGLLIPVRRSKHQSGGGEAGALLAAPGRGSHPGCESRGAGPAQTQVVVRLLWVKWPPHKVNSAQYGFEASPVLAHPVKDTGAPPYLWFSNLPPPLWFWWVTSSEPLL